MAEENVEKTEPTEPTAPTEPTEPTESTEATEPIAQTEHVEAPKVETAQAAEETVSASQKKKKISQMTLEEVDAKIKTVQDKMGGLGSQYAQQLLKRKQVLGG